MRYYSYSELKENLLLTFEGQLRWAYDLLAGLPDMEVETDPGAK